MDPFGKNCYYYCNNSSISTPQSHTFSASQLSESSFIRILPKYVEVVRIYGDYSHPTHGTTRTTCISSAVKLFELVRSPHRTAIPGQITNRGDFCDLLDSKYYIIDIFEEC